MMDAKINSSSDEEARLKKIKHILASWLDKYGYNYKIIEMTKYPCVVKEMFYRPVSCFACKEDCIQYNYLYTIKLFPYVLVQGEGVFVSLCNKCYSKISLVL